MSETPNIEDLVLSVRRLIAACRSPSDFCDIRPMSLGFGVCGFDHDNHRYRQASRGWLSYWGRRLHKPMHEINEAHIHLAHAKLNEFSHGLEFSTRSIYGMRRQFGIDTPHLLCGVPACMVCTRARSDENRRKLDELRMSVARELSIPPFMFGG